ncbi:cupin domain-containing protein [Micromonospora sp. KC606]|uniref:cupin domain-containing protein n=1 Tax=Micromonospora sp. KC606 TaxID=2530379 RepID=UPI00104F9F6F|nr:cupin domain-containing protein [Micromonospora sp. KC606]TDC81659.1 cupin domain-containing protein [Micromonospora sp. KC606]
MITKFQIGKVNAVTEFGMVCQRLVPWNGQAPEPPVGAMACFLPAGSESMPDCHNQTEVMFVLSGAGTVRVGGQQTAIDELDLVVIPANEEHVVYNPNGAELSWVSFWWPLHEPGSPAAPEGVRDE